ncbi:WYL domain-containing protein [Peredibacter starrii]|uniref:WYL domain-containing protein n=1 Tax=Peredibacter starrii TaxID=28202 RepID=A0AAX4HT61_9BACT|nr:WYL domain-containing protein [Peredibacter starrii]WPU66529.1 WYL domain-containing protein [Peredibacter starrii]
MSKTTNYLNILYKISLSPTRYLSESSIKEMMGNPPKSTWHRQINELLEGSKDVPPLLIETLNPSGERLFCLNTKGWQAFLDAQEEGKFLLECYRQVGHLLDSHFTDMVFDLADTDRRHFDRLGRKFMHLVTVKASHSLNTRKTLDSVIEALIGEKQIELTYDGGLRKVMPLTLCQYRDELYLMCYRIKDDSLWEKRTYKLSRINGIRVLDKKFPYPSKSEWDPIKEYKNSSGLVLGEIKRVMLKVYGPSRKIFSEKEFFNGEFVNRGEDFDAYLCSYTNSAELLGQIFVYAQDIEIVDNEELRNEFVIKAQQGLLRNKLAA